MADQVDTYFRVHKEGLESPATRGFAISANESANVTHTTRAVYVGGTGDLVCELADDADGTTVTFTAVPAGTILPIRLRKMRTASTATSVVGIY